MTGPSELWVTFSLQTCTAYCQLLTTFEKMHFENIVAKGENADNQHFLLFPQCFLPYQREIVV